MTKLSGAYKEIKHWNIPIAFTSKIISENKHSRLFEQCSFTPNNIKHRRNNHYKLMSENNSQIIFEEYVGSTL